jgi:hypothetical protein
MNLYRWKSEYLENYRRGDIIVMAESVSDAREAALRKFESEPKENVDELFYDDEVQEKAEYTERQKAKFEADISTEPIVIEGGVLFIEGSD